MPSKLISIATLALITAIAMPALPAEGDYRGSDGYGPNGYSFILSQLGDLDQTNQTIEITIDFDETHSVAKGPRPPKPDLKNTARGKGCFVHLADPNEISCKDDAVPSIFRGVVYERRPHKKAERYLVCVKNCSKDVPRVLVWTTEGECEDCK